MKINEPLTDREVPFPENTILVSKTDRKGIITYANPAFVQISGYAESELLGVNHNVVRHPDMPPEAFADLWDELNRGRTWTGIVKNRAKSGDYYWVKANVTPIPLPNGDVEYMSVRTQPARAEIEFAEKLYADIRAKRFVLPSTNSQIDSWTMERILGFGAGGALLGLGVLAGLLVMGAPAAAMFAVLAVIALLIVASGVLMRQRVIEPLKLVTGKLRQFVVGDYFDWAAVNKGGIVGDIMDATRATQVKIGFEVLDARRRADEATRSETALDCVTTNVMMADDDFNVIYMNKAVARMFSDAEDDLQKSIPGFDASDIMGKNIDIFHKQPDHQRRMLAQLDGTHTSEVTVGPRTFRIIANPVVNAEGQRLGTVVEWADLTAELAAKAAEEERMTTERRYAQENLRIRTALDNVSSSVMMADAGNNIVYMNKTVRALFKAAEKDIKKDLPNFDASDMLGQNIDVFHKNPPHQQRLVEAMSSTLKSTFVVGGHTLAFTANPVMSEDGERLGTAVEWVDRTSEVATENEIEGLVAAARSGNLDERITLDDKEGFFKHIGVGMNALMDTLKAVFEDLGATMQEMSEGRFTRPVSGAYEGEFNDLKDSLNNTLVHVSKTLVELRDVGNAINMASNEITSGNTNLSSRTEQQASSLEETAASMEELTSTVRNNADNAQQANQVSSSARQLAEKGGEVVRNAITAMEEISESSNKIAEIIAVIDEIAFQTNLLALNASVEAARAGEQGRGFAVVATEVRNLASRSADAAKEIKELIQDSAGKVQAGSDLVNMSGETLSEIVDGVKKVGDIVAEIAAASNEQASGIDQVNKAVTSMDEITQQNAALAEEISATSASLFDKAQEMEQVINFFDVSDDPEAMVERAAEHSASHKGHGHGEGFDFFAARTAHMAWRQKIRDFLDGKQSLSHAEAVSHRDCALGKWLYSEGMKTYGHIEDMQVMEKRHETLHATIREIIDLKNANKSSEAENRYAEIENLSGQIVHLLNSVERKVEQ